MVYEKGLIRVDRGQLIDKGNYAFDPAHPDFAGGADPDGLKDASRAFVDCDTEAFQRGAGVRPSIGVYRIARNITLKSGWDLPEGVVIRPDSGVTVTFDGRVRGMGDRDAQLDTSAGGSFTTNGPEWFYGDQGFLGTIIDRGGAQHDARAYGAVLDGTTDDRTALADAITAAQASGIKVVIVAGGTALVESNLTVPEGVTLRVLEGAKLKPANGVTLTINGTFDAGLYSVFDLSEGGSVVLGTDAVASVLPHWWGAVGDGVADDRAALSAADATGRAVMLPAGTYRVGSSLTLASAWQVRSGGLFRPANGVTVTINGAFEAGLYQVFDTSAGGRVVFGPGVVDVVYPEWWGVDGTFAGDTAAWQAAIDAAQEIGGTVLGAVGATYYLTNLLVTGDCTLDFNGASIVADPTTDGVLGAPLIWGRGTRAAGIPIASASEGAQTITLTVPGAGAGFSPGDLITISDSTHVPAWNDGTSGTPPPGDGYTGRAEVNVVKAVAGDTLTLAKRLEWDYTTKPYCDRIAVAPRITVKNIGEVTEVDPGAPYSSGNLTGQVPHILHFQWCRTPRVSNVHVRNYQLHGVNFHQCLDPLVEKCSFRDAFRPTNGGHGYGVRFQYCSRGVARQNVSERIRHTVDVNQSYDTISEANTAIQTIATAYMTHGLGAKRYTSINDYVEGQGDTSASGWAIGNSSFAGDYDVRIINPTCKGLSHAIIVGYTSERVEIVTPRVHGTFRTLIVTTGAKDVTLIDGVVDMRGEGGSTDIAIMVRDTRSDDHTVGITPQNFTMRGVTVYAPSSPRACYIDAEGTIRIEDCKLVGQSGAGILLQIAETKAPENVYILDNETSGEHTRSITLVQAPTGAWEFQRNAFKDYTVLPGNIKPTSNLRMRDNIALNGGSWSFQSTNVPLDAVIVDNVPSNADRPRYASGTATIANGTTSVVVPHGLSRTPTVDEIMVTPTNNLGNATKFWISSPNGNDFTINVDADPGASGATFAWRVRVA